MRARILIIEDEVGIANFLKQGLEEESFTVDVSYNGRDGLIQSLSGDYDLLLLDWVMPGMSGVEVCRHFRSEFPDTPVIFLTAKDTVDETVFGLQAGASDYVKKPFHFSELLERIKVQLRTQLSSPTKLDVGPIAIDVSAHQVKCFGRELNLTVKEFALLELLARNKGNVCTRAVILDKVWGVDPEADTGVIDVNINALRKKLGPVVSEKYLRTVRGIGYMLKEVGN